MVTYLYHIELILYLYLVVFNQINCKSMDNWHKILLPWPLPQPLSGISHVSSSLEIGHPPCELGA
jgi:hypothetical protein